MKTIEKTVLTQFEYIDKLTTEVKELEAQNLELRRKYNALEIQKSEDITKLAFDIMSIAYILENPMVGNRPLDESQIVEIKKIFANVRPKATFVDGTN